MKFEKVEKIHGKIVVFYKLKKSYAHLSEKIEEEWHHYYKNLWSKTIKLNQSSDDEEFKIDIADLAK